MTVRYHLFGKESRVAVEKRTAKTKYGQISGWLIVIAITSLYLLWLAYRWLHQPTWTHSLSTPVVELLDLLEMAAAMTLILVWAGLIWRRFWNRSPRTPRTLALDQLLELSPGDFEQYVAGLFQKKGYKVIVRGGSGDHGVDLELFGDGSKRAVVQCKRYRDTVGEEVVRDLYGTLLHERATRAFLVTTADISDAARDWSTGKPITLVDGSTLVAISNSLI